MKKAVIVLGLIWLQSCASMMGHQRTAKLADFGDIEIQVSTHDVVTLHGQNGSYTHTMISSGPRFKKQSLWMRSMTRPSR